MPKYRLTNKAVDKTGNEKLIILPPNMENIPI